MSYYQNRKKLSFKAIAYLMVAWNQKNSQPLRPAEITNIILSAKKRGYLHSREKMKEFCVPRCPYRKAA